MGKRSSMQSGIIGKGLELQVKAEWKFQTHVRPYSNSVLQKEKPQGL